MTKPWADGPFPLIPVLTEAEGISENTVKVAAGMAFIHNIFIRNINSIVLQFENLSKPQDISDFLVFCQAWHESVHLHHHEEEEFFFPAIEAYSGEKGIMEINVKQHHDFHDGLKKFGEYVYGTVAETYDVQTFKEILDSFTPALMQHLTDEIQTLLSLEKYGGDKLMETWKALEKKIVAMKIDPYRVIPWALGGAEKRYDTTQDFPFPWFVPYMSYFWFSRRHKGAWRFSPCTLFGKAKDLPFAKEVK